MSEFHHDFGQLAHDLKTVFLKHNLPAPAGIVFSSEADMNKAYHRLALGVLKDQEIVPTIATPLKKNHIPFFRDVGFFYQGDAAAFKEAMRKAVEMATTIMFTAENSEG